MNILELKEQLVEFSRRCYDRHLICATGGNLSCRIPNENAILIKGTGSAFSDMTIDDVVKIDLEGNVLKGKVDKSKEWRFHAGIYKARADIDVVFHVHPPYATAVAANFDELPLITNHAKGYLKYVPTIGSAPSGSELLSENVIKGFKDSDLIAMLLREHGVIVASDSFRKAFYLTEMLEDTAKIVLFSKLK